MFMFSIRRFVNFKIHDTNLNMRILSTKVDIPPLHKMKKNKISHDRGYILLVLPSLCFVLGVWQVERRKWKLNLIKELEEKKNAPAIPLPSNYEELEDLEYRKVFVKGKFDHSKEQYLLPRSNIQDRSMTKNMPSYNSSGLYVITPFMLSSNGDKILINRGWVPRNKMDPRTRLEAQVEDEIEIQGLVRQSEKKKSNSNINDPHRNEWFVRNIDVMSSVLETKPVFIDADINSTLPGGPIGGQTVVSIRNEHLQYIFTWFTLSAATFYMWYKAYWKVRR